MTEINYDQQGAKVKTSDGQVYKAKYVIVTAPLGVLKTNSIKFTPALSNEKKRAIQNLGFGVYDKVYYSLRGRQLQKMISVLLMGLMPPASKQRRKL